jgi:hypothetical protein
MSERIVSPGVFTRENDLSFLTQGISEIGGAFIGPTPKGPAFIPTIVRSQQDYVTLFGDADPNHYTGLAVKNYLTESGIATVVRVLGIEGYSSASHAPAAIYITGSGGKFLYALLHPSIDGVSVVSASGSGTPTNFELLVSSSALTINKTGLSTDVNSENYVSDFLGTSPQTSNGVYIYALFPEAVSLAGSTGSVEVTRDLNLLNFTNRSYSHATTPWIQSQTLGGQTFDLFKFHTIGDGNSANQSIKVSFTNMKLSTNPEDPYGTFSLLVRRYNDTDTRTSVLEQYDNVTLDPDSPNYIARLIGNSLPTEDQVTGEIYYQGDFRNRSSYVIVEINEDGNVPQDALPYGFAPYQSPVFEDASILVPPNYLTTRWISGSVEGYNLEAVDRRHYYGWDFRNLHGTNASYLNAVTTNAPAVGSAFSLENIIDVPKTTAPFSQSVSLDVEETLPYRRFSVAFQGGFDGQNPARKIALGEEIVATNSQGFNLATAQSAGSRAYFRALQAISNPDQFDFNLLVIPGVLYTLHSSVTSRALDLCESRGDAFYIMDTVGINANLTTAVQAAGEIDSNYAATYYPWLRVIDTNTNRLLWVPPSVILPEVYAYNDNIAAEWFAPAGLNRGGISNAVGVKVRLPQQSRDILYEGKVNPIAQFAGQGIAVWGQKTLQRRASALDRVNVRRLLIAVKKFIASTSRYLVFEQNVEATRNRFLNIVNPYLASVQERSGLFAFRVIMDESNNTPDLIDRNILYGQLFLQPTRTAEFIVLDFNVLPTGAVFPSA